MDTIEDVIDAIEEALDAAESIRDNTKQQSDAKAAAIEAITQMRRGQYADAVTTLEREFMPKWQDKATAEAAYRRAML